MNVSGVQWTFLSGAKFSLYVRGSLCQDDTLRVQCTRDEIWNAEGRNRLDNQCIPHRRAAACMGINHKAMANATQSIRVVPHHRSKGG